MNSTAKIAKQASPKLVDSKPEQSSSSNSSHSHEAANPFVAAVERSAEIQNKWLDLAAEQSSEMIEAYKGLTSFGSGVPAVYDSTRLTFETYIDIQRNVMDLLAKQAAALSDLAKQRGTSASFAAEFTQTMQESVDRVLAAQKSVLEMSVRQMGRVQDMAIALLPEAEQRWRKEALSRSARVKYQD